MEHGIKYRWYFVFPLPSAALSHVSGSGGRHIFKTVQPKRLVDEAETQGSGRIFWDTLPANSWGIYDSVFIFHVSGHTTFLNKANEQN